MHGRATYHDIVAASHCEWKRPPLPRRTMDARRGVHHVAFSPAALLRSLERRHMLAFIDHHEV